MKKRSKKVPSIKRKVGEKAGGMTDLDDLLASAAAKVVTTAAMKAGPQGV